MASSINASVTSNGIVQAADASGVLQLQSDGVTGLSINNGGKVIYPSTALSTATNGTLEYDGKVPYFTPQSVQRGVVPGMQYYVTSAQVVGSNATGAQSILGVGVTLSSNTFYAFEGQFNFFKTAGTTSHTFALQWGGTATSHRFVTNVLSTSSAFGYVTVDSTRNVFQYVMESASATPLTGAITSAFYTVNIRVRGFINVNAGGTLIPQYALSAAPGGAYSGSGTNYMSIWPIGAGGNSAVVNVGTWA